MKKLIVASLLIGLGYFGGEVKGRTVCSQDYIGRTVCRTDGGDTYTGSKDYLGRDVWSGSDGSRQVCSKDYLGRYVCQ